MDYLSRLPDEIRPSHYKENGILTSRFYTLLGMAVAGVAYEPETKEIRYENVIPLFPTYER